MKSAPLILLLCLLVPEPSWGEPTDLLLFRPALPSGTTVTSSCTAENLTVDIKTPDSHHPFWESHPTVRISYSTNVPTISLVTNIGTPEEVRLVLRPKNIHRQFDAPPGELILEADGGAIGVVALSIQEGSIDTHRARYILRQDALERLGRTFVLVSGNSFIHHITNDRPSAVDSPGTDGWYLIQERQGFQGAN